MGVSAKRDGDSTSLTPPNARNYGVWSHGKTRRVRPAGERNVRNARGLLSWPAGVGQAGQGRTPNKAGRCGWNDERGLLLNVESKQGATPMKYERILAAVAATPWAIEPNKGRQIAGILTRRLNGHAPDPAG